MLRGLTKVFLCTFASDNTQKMNNKSFVRHIPYIVSGLFFIASVYFWMYKYPAHLAFQEQSQLFLLTGDYFLPFLEYPSGIARYLGEFLTQFFYEIWWGAAIISLIVVAVFALSFSILSHEIHNRKILCTALATIPAIFSTAFLLDRFSLLAMPVALLATLASVIAYQQWLKHISIKALRHTIIIVSTVSLFWAFGAVSFIFALFVAFAEIFQKRDFIALSHIAVMSVLPILAYTVVPSPLQRLYTSNFYYKIMDECPSFKYDRADEEALLYSFFSRYKKWDATLKRANRSIPTDIASKQVILHALAEKDLLLENLFEYPVSSKKDLIWGQLSEMAEASTVSDLFFSLGMINQAEVYIYNMQQLYFGQSVRAFQRLVECNIIKSDYRVAQKYINALKQTLFYRDWAVKMEALYKNEATLESHPYYGPIRSRLIKDTFFHSDDELDNILAHSIMSSENSNILYDYLTAFLILSNDLDNLVKLMTGNQNRMPKAVQEALVFHWISNNPSFDGMPWNIDQEIMFNAVSFMRQLNEGGNMQSMRPTFGKTYWYYNTFISRHSK